MNGFNLPSTPQNSEINYLPDEKEITIDMSVLKDVAVHYKASDSKREKTEEGNLTIKLPALSAVMVSYSGSTK